MRFIKEIPNQAVKISLFAWNSKFIVKFEAGMYEQTYKFSEMDYTESEIENGLSASFIDAVITRFHAMDKDISIHFELDNF